jgi:nucleoporin NDC1
MKAKKETVKTFAFWELCYISQRFPDRRKAIFNDIDREGGAAWTQILNVSTTLIKGVTTRIHEFKNPPSTPAPPPANSKDSKPTTNSQAIQTLPRITPAPKDDNIFLSSPKPNSGRQKFEAALSPVAKSYGQSADWTPSARAKARNMFDRASTTILSPERKKKLLLIGAPTDAGQQPAAAAKTHPLMVRALRSPIGLPFRQTFTRRLRGIVLGSPHASLAPIVDATESLTRLLIASLAEDPFGKVQTDVPAVVRLFTETIIALESFVSESGLDVHWTDVDFPSSSSPPASTSTSVDGSPDLSAQQQARQVEDVEIVLRSLRTGLAELLAAFRLYLGEVGLVGKDLRLAKEAAGSLDD